MMIDAVDINDDGEIDYSEFLVSSLTQALTQALTQLLTQSLTKP